MRIGKLERWILKHAYLKWVGKLPDKWNCPRCCFVNKREEDRPDNLYKSEVLLNYFDRLRLSHKECLEEEREKFYTDKQYKTALASYTRTVNAMEKKGYIEVVAGMIPGFRDVFWRGLTLTATGRGIAEKLLNVNSGP